MHISRDDISVEYIPVSPVWCISAPQCLPPHAQHLHAMVDSNGGGIVERFNRICYDARFLKLWAVVLFVFDAFLSRTIIAKIPYTEIDWVAYMEQISQILNGERDYSLIKGGTGPLVYPAGHVEVFKLLYKLTNNGTDIAAAQTIFLYVYLFTLAVVLRIYTRAKIHPVYMTLLVLSKRLHSIYLLRLFNDCFVTLFAVVAISLLQACCDPGIGPRTRRVRIVTSAVCMSLAVSTKMSALLYLPGYGISLWHMSSLKYALAMGVPMAAFQIAIAAPFLDSHAKQYLNGAFELSRRFMYKWTVNWRFVHESLFSSDRFAKSLLIVHASTLFAFVYKWLSHYKPIDYRTDPKLAVKIIALSNLIGILAARSLHYQFYAWFYWSVPLLLFTSSMPFYISIPLWFFQECAWNVYPSTNASSLTVILSLALTVATNW